MPKVAICCKASVSDGMGHIYRQVNLANELSKQNWKVSFYIPDFAPAIDLLTRFGYPLTLVDLKLSISKYFNKLFDLTILDIQDTTESIVYSVKKFSSQVISFEDLGSGRNHADILIDCNLAPSESKKLTFGKRALFGADYSVLHPDFADFHNRPRRFNTSIQSAIITMGATDPKELTLPLTKLLLKEKSDLNLTVLTGHNTIGKPQLGDLATQFKSLNLLGPVPDMAKTLWEHEVVVCAGGVTLHEAIAVGTPALVINQAEHQNSKAHFIEKSGAAINLGMGDKYDIKKLRKALGFGKRELELMSLKGRKLIDGQGIFRVTEALTKLIKK